MSAPAAGVSIREFARREGCDDKLVRRAISRSALQLRPDGLLDPALVGGGWRKTNRSADRSADTAPSVRTSPQVSAPAVRTRRKVSAPPRDEQAATPIKPQPHDGSFERASAPEPTPEEMERVAEELVEAVDKGFIADVMAGQFASHHKAEQIKENALAFKHLLAARRAAGALVDIETAEAVLFEAFRAIRDAWLNWPTRVAALVAADLDLEADRVTEVLTLYVHQHLAELGEPEADFAGAEQPV